MHLSCVARGESAAEPGSWKQFQDRKARCKRPARTCAASEQVEHGTLFRGLSVQKLLLAGEDLGQVRQVGHGAVRRVEAIQPKLNSAGERVVG